MSPDRVCRSHLSAIDLAHVVAFAWVDVGDLGVEFEVRAMLSNGREAFFTIRGSHPGAGDSHVVLAGCRSSAEQQLEGLLVRWKMVRP